MFNADTTPQLTRQQALAMFRGMPLLELGALAFAHKRMLHGDRITYVHNLHINPTNLCVYKCGFCGFAARPGDAHAYSLDEADILQQTEDPELSEVHIVGGLWPKWGLQRSLGLVRALRNQRPDIFIKAFTAVEVAYFARMERLSSREVIAAMLEAGVDCMPGGGAEVLSDRIHQLLYPQKIGPADWLRIHEEAHELGLQTNATLLFGHLETDEELVEHLFLLRESQERHPGFSSFIPLAYQPDSTALVTRIAPAPACLRVIALARLVLGNIPHVKAYWPTLQLETAVAALSFGADDLDGTLGQERIMQLGGSKSAAQLTREHLQSMIREAGQQPVERTGSYERARTLVGVQHDD